jgi:uncharacterized protein
VNASVIRHLTPADYTSMPWANGLGQTTEMVRVEADGAVLWRLSMASVVADGAFSLFPGIERNLTVLDGPGFDLVGDGVALECRPLQPVAFAGDVAVEARGVTAPSQDFNVMTARALPKPRVRVVKVPVELVPPRHGVLCLLALRPAQAGGMAMALHDLILTHKALQISGGPVIAVEIGLG